MRSEGTATRSPSDPKASSRNEMAASATIFTRLLCARAPMGRFREGDEDSIASGRPVKERGCGRFCGRPKHPNVIPTEPSVVPARRDEGGRVEESRRESLPARGPA